MKKMNTTKLWHMCSKRTKKSDTQFYEYKDYIEKEEESILELLSI